LPSKFAVKKFCQNVNKVLTEMHTAESPDEAGCISQCIRLHQPTKPDAFKCSIDMHQKALRTSVTRLSGYKKKISIKKGFPIKPYMAYGVKPPV